jgi:hypothetical protein
VHDVVGVATEGDPPHPSPGDPAKMAAIMIASVDETLAPKGHELVGAVRLC